MFNLFNFFKLRSLKQLVLFNIILISVVIGPVYSEELGFTEAKIKTAYLYNFLNFLEWPDDSNYDKHICVIGHKEDYHDAIFSIREKTLNGRNIVVDEYEQVKDMQDVINCQLVFITEEATHRQKMIVNIIKEKNILTVGESRGFIDHGGIINFITKENNVRFEINLAAAREANIRIPSTILRIATRIIK